MGISVASQRKTEEHEREKQAPSNPSFSKGLFFGRLLPDLLFPFPIARPEEADVLQMTIESLGKLMKGFSIERIEEEKRIPADLLEKLKEMGLFGLIIPEAYGGFGLSNHTYLQIMGSLSLVDASLTVTVGAHQSIGLKALMMFGTEKQKREYLPRLASGEMLAAFALTEPGAGSDARSLRTTATLSEDGNHYVLNGNKIWITNGGIADFFTVFARTDDSITAFIVTRGMTGFSSGPEEKKLGLVGSSTTSLHFDNVKVPVENVLGEPGKGFKIALEVLNNGRIGLAGACALSTKKLVQLALDHASQRKQFGQPLVSFGIIQSKLATLAADAYAAEAMVQVAAGIMDRGGCDYSLETAMCKVYCTELQWRAVNEALQIAGGAGYMKEYGYEKILRDSRIFQIWEGTNEILRLFIGLSGVAAPGEQLKEISVALKQPLTDVIHSLGVLRDFGKRWLRRRVGNPDTLDPVHPYWESEKATFEKYTAKFAASVETTLLRKGKRIVSDEYTVRRLADTAIDLFAMACTLSRSSQMLDSRPEEECSLEIACVKSFFRRARRRVAENLRRLERNDDNLETKITEELVARGGYPALGVFC